MNKSFYAPWVCHISKDENGNPIIEKLAPDFTWEPHPDGGVDPISLAPLKHKVMKEPVELTEEEAAALNQDTAKTGIMYELIPA